MVFSCLVTHSSFTHLFLHIQDEDFLTARLILFICFLSGWANFVQGGILRWKMHIYSWLIIFTGAKHIVFYEHLQKQLLEELIKLSTFLQTNSTLSDIWCTFQNREGLFHRQKPEWFVPSSLFTDNMTATVQSEIEELYKLMPTHAVSPEVLMDFTQLYRKSTSD